ncbi:GLPGLI family protein [Sinomicrobium sp. M5D2P17]
MKKIILPLIALVSLHFSLAQDLKAKITYEVTLDNTDFHDRLIKDTTITEFSRNAHLEDIRSTSPMNFILYINGKEALYQCEYDLQQQRSLGFGYNRTGSVGRSDNVYYVNLGTGEKYYQNFFTKEVIVDMEKVNWILTKETKKIGKYTCYKATATIDSEQEPGMGFMTPVEAWYTPDIATSFGIQYLQGLPGLTLELIADHKDGKLFYKVTDIALNPKPDIYIKKPEAERRMSQQKYLAYLKKLNENRFR